jgi:hypothetical protein
VLSLAPTVLSVNVGSTKRERTRAQNKRLRRIWKLGPTRTISRDHVSDPRLWRTNVPARGIEPASADGRTATLAIEQSACESAIAPRTPPAVRLMLLAGTVASTLSLTSGAEAQEAPKTGWEFFITPYAWVSSLGGAFSSTTPGAPTHTASAGLGSVLTHLNSIPLMVNLEARNHRFGIMSDLMVVSLRAPVSTGPYFSGATAQTTQFVTTEMGMYRVLEQRKQWLDLGVGFRTVSVWSKLTFNSGLAPGFTTSSAVSWAAPLFSIRYHYNLTPRFGLTGYADVGGSGGGNMTSEVLGMLDYRYDSWLMLHVGYRHMHIDYTGSALRVGIALSGPFLGATFQF